MSHVDSLRYAADNGTRAQAIVGLNGFKVFLVTVENEQLGFNDTSAGRTKTETPITVADGYNPHVQYLVKMSQTGTQVLAGGALSTMELMLGPLAFPYNTGFASGGTDPTSFQPLPQSNTDIYVHITGDGMNTPNGNYFEVMEIVLGGLDNITYYVRLRGILDVII